MQATKPAEGLLVTRRPRPSRRAGPSLWRCRACGDMANPPVAPFDRRPQARRLRPPDWPAPLRFLEFNVILMRPIERRSGLNPSRVNKCVTLPRQRVQVNGDSARARGMMHIASDGFIGGEHGRFRCEVAAWPIGSYYYPRPIYPYPDPYVPPYATLPPPPVDGPPAFWYSCDNPRGYYPYVPRCYGFTAPADPRKAG